MSTKQSSTNGTLPSLLRFGVFDPSPEGHVLPSGVIPQALRDFAALSTVAVLEAPAVGMVSNGEELIALHQHRLALIVEHGEVESVLGHLENYANTVLEGHPVTVEISALGMMS